MYVCVGRIYCLGENIWRVKLLKQKGSESTYCTSDLLGGGGGGAKQLWLGRVTWKELPRVGS